MGCFNFERVKAWIFKLFGKCFKPIGWDGDIRKLRKRLTKVYSFFVPSPLRGMATVFATLDMLLPCRSKPTVWDGDFVSPAICFASGISQVLSPPCGMVIIVICIFEVQL